MASVAERVKHIELSEHLRRGFGSRNAAVKLDNVAKLAIKRAAARELNPNMEIVIKFQQVEARRGAFGDVSLPHRRDEFALPPTAPPGGDEIVHDLFGFAKNAEISAVIEVWG